jgi:hypothetical protein
MDVVFAVLVLAIFASFILSFIVFATGQLIGGLMVGFSLNSFRLGPFMLGRVNGRLRPQWAPPAHPRRFDARFEIPEEKASGLRRAIMVLCGPAANFLVGIAGVATLQWHFSDVPLGALPRGPRLGPWPIHDWVDEAVVFFGIAGGVNLLTVALSLIPITISGKRSAGGQLLDLLRGRPVTWHEFPLHNVKVPEPARDEVKQSTQVAAQPMNGCDAISAEFAWDTAARTALERSREAATAMKSDYLGTKHLLLALVTEGSHKQWAEGLDLGWVLAAIHIRSVVNADNPVPPSGQPMTPRLKACLQRANGRAQRAGRLVNSQDLWCGLLADPDSECVTTLDQLGFRAEALLAMIEKENRLPEFSGIQRPPGVRAE